MSKYDVKVNISTSILVCFKKNTIFAAWSRLEKYTEWQKSRSEKYIKWQKSRLENFLIRYKGLCTPVEVKAVSGNAKSLKTVMNHPEKYHVNQAIKLGDYNIGRTNGVLTLPLYMAFLLTEY